MRLKIAALVACCGCATNFAGGVPATGEPLTAGWGTFRQGKTPIDEQDFYQIAHDQESFDAIRHTRRRGLTYNRVGIALALAGVAALVVGVTLDHRAYGGSVLLPIGGIMAYYGKAVAEEQPLLPVRHAQEVADRYNATVAP